jgi:uncharacterized phage-associated protein
MEKLVFCEYCMSENYYKVHNINKTSKLKNEKIDYMAKEGICSICRNEVFVSEICDYNLRSLYEEYRKKHNIISVKQIKRILVKYSISEEALSLLLGWKGETINRYLEGDITVDSHSETLKKIYENPDYYSVVLQTNKEKINPIDYNKSRQAVKDALNNYDTEEKIDAVIKYILIRCEDFTHFTLQNLLYYVQAFNYAFTKKFIFKEDCEANVSGPIYRSVFERYEKFGYEEINKDILANKNLRLDNAERNIVESIIKFYGCYSGKVLKQMAYYEAPWVLTQAGSENEFNTRDEENNKIIDKKLIAEYFNGIKERYCMTNLLDIQKYSIDMFNKISI